MVNLCISDDWMFKILKASQAACFLNFFSHYSISMNIYIGNLNFKIQEDEIRSIFSNYGEVADVKVIRDRETSRSKGFGFVEMPNDAEGRDAIANLNQSEVMGRPMVVNEAKPRESR